MCQKSLRWLRGCWAGRSAPGLRSLLPPRPAVAAVACWLPRATAGHPSVTSPAPGWTQHHQTQSTSSEYSASPAYWNPSLLTTVPYLTSLLYTVQVCGTHASSASGRQLQLRGESKPGSSKVWDALQISILLERKNRHLMLVRSYYTEFVKRQGQSLPNCKEVSLSKQLFCINIHDQFLMWATHGDQ